MGLLGSDPKFALPKLGHAKFGCQNFGKNFGIALGWVPNWDSQNFGP